jgi:hypothetical protein
MNPLWISRSEYFLDCNIHSLGVFYSSKTKSNSKAKIQNGGRPHLITANGSEN